jgi:drug/metabolite transporter (DMT)-like permease
MSAATAAPRSQLIGAFAAIYLVWGSTYLAIAIAVETLPPFFMAATRFAVSGVILYAFLWSTKRIAPTAKQWRDNAIVGGFLMLGGNGLVSWAQQYVPSGIATLIISSGPIVVVLLDWAVHAADPTGRRGGRPNLPTWIGLALGFAGLVMLIGPDVANGTGGLTALTVAALVGACVFWSTGSLYGRYASQPAEPFTAAAIQMLTGSLWLFGASLLAGEPATLTAAAFTARSVGAWLYLTLVGSLVGFTAFVWLMKHSTPARVYTYTYVNPIVAVFLGWLILDETVSPRIFTAAAVIIAGVALITFARTRLPSAPVPGPTPVPASRAVPATK